MKPTSISAEALFEAHREALHWEWIAGHAHPERRFADDAVRDARSAADLVGYLNYIHPYRVQIVGRREVAYLTDASPEVLERRISRIVTLEPPVLIVADGQQPPDRLVAMCDRAEIPLFVTGDSAGHVIDLVRGYLGQHFADRTTRHGVFMDILGLGVLLTGESGLGKSELGLELVSAAATAWWPTTRWTSTAPARPRWKAVARSCCKTCWKCAASACWTSRPSLARRPCAARCA